MNELALRNIPDEFKEIASILQLDTQLLGDYSIKAVNGRRLQEVLGNQRKHTTWAMEQIEKCTLEAGIDFEILSVRISVPSNSTKAREQDGKEFIFTINAAKEISMMAREKGKLVRQYFLYMEKVAQNAYRGILPSTLVELPKNTSAEINALEEFEYYSKVLSSALSVAWSQGYVQKSIAMAASDIDNRHNTHICRLIPAPVALIGQKEEIDITKGEHMLRQTIGSKEMSTVQFASIFNLKSTTPLNETLVSLGYQLPLKDSRKRNISGYTVVSGKERYVTQIPISSPQSPFIGEYRISNWILNSFTEYEKEQIRDYILKNYKRNVFNGFCERNPLNLQFRGGIEQK